MRACTKTVSVGLISCADEKMHCTALFRGESKLSVNDKACSLLKRRELNTFKYISNLQAKSIQVARGPLKITQVGKEKEAPFSY